MENIILDCDSYKSSHFMQYPPDTQSMFSYIESRGGLYDKTVFFGLQYIISNFLTKRITIEDVYEAAAFFKEHGEPFPLPGWLRIATTLKGKLPVRIRAVPEGSVVPVSLPLVTIESTDKETFWVASWLETMLMRVWYPTNVATIGYHIKKSIMSALELSADDPKGEIAFKLHDFGARGVSSRESAAIGGAAHLVNFRGSDTVAGVRMANMYYSEKMAGFSIPATEHSSITSWGREHEIDAYRNILTRFAKPGALVACVSDSYDIYNACSRLWGEELREAVIASGATLVIRPDSGTPRLVVLRCLDILGQKFGFTVNAKGFKVLNTVRIIQGDGINHDSINEILFSIMENGWSATNVAFGMGGGLLQQHNRDTQRFAMKCSSVTVNDIERDVYKDPIDDQMKASKKGRLDLEIFEGRYNVAILKAGALKAPYSIMQTVFENGEMMNLTTLAEIRKRSEG